VGNALKKQAIREEDVYRSIILRGSFLHERDVPAGTVPPMYAGRLEQIEKTLAGVTVPFVQDFVTDLKKRCGCVQKNSLGTHPAWFDYMLRLEKEGNKETGNGKKNIPFSSILHVVGRLFNQDLERNSSLPQRFRETLNDYVLQCALDIAGITLFVDYREYCQLQGKNPCQELYRQWQDEYSKGRWIVLAEKYPLLVRFLYEMHRNVLCHVSELLERFELDKSLLASMLKCETLTLDDAEFGLSDFHNHGRTVARLIFKEGHSVIYKPKPLANEHWFFSEFLPAAGEAAQAIGTLEILDRGSYGWAQDVLTVSEHERHLTEEEKIGQSVAIFYALNSTDMHSENIIQKNGRIYPVDLETILNAVGDFSWGKKYEGESWKNWPVLATELLRSQISVKPEESRGNGFSQDVLISPFKKGVLFVSENQGVEIKVFDSKTLGLLAQAEQKNESLKKEDNLSPDPKGAASVFSGSFQSLQSLANEPAFFENEALKNCVVRSIFRDTMFYERLVERIRQPKLLTDAALMSLDLADLMLPVKDMPTQDAERMAPIYHDEMMQVMGGDIPYFWHSVESRDLKSMNGTVAKNFFSRSGLHEFQQKLTQATSADLKEQVNLMEASLLLEGKNFDSLPIGRPKMMPMSHEDILLKCREIGETIADRAIVRAGKPAVWVSYTADTSGDKLRPGVVGTSYYSGYWGILLFLTALHAELKDKNCECKKLELFLQRECNHWKVDFKEGSCFEAGLGLSSGGGQIMTMAILRDLNPAWDFFDQHLVKYFEDFDTGLIQKDDYLDIIGGSAGFLLSVAALVRSKAFEAFPAVTKAKVSLCVRQMVRHLMEKAVPQQQGIGWILPKQEHALLGYAHGSAGIVAALQSALTQHDLFGFNNQKVSAIRETIRQSLEYQAFHRIGEEGWIDLRHDPLQKVPLNQSWCHGLPGLGLGLLSQAGVGERCLSDLKIITEKILTMDAGHGDYYCCGAMGAADFLLETSRVLGDRTLFEGGLAKASSILTNLDNSQTFQSRIGAMKPDVFPGLFQGVAGIAYTALRFINPNLPSLSGFHS